MTTTAGARLAQGARDALTCATDATTTPGASVLLMVDLPTPNVSGKARAYLSRHGIVVLGSRGAPPGGTVSLYAAASVRTWLGLADTLARRATAPAIGAFRPDVAADKVRSRTRPGAAVPVSDDGLEGWEATLHPDVDGTTGQGVPAGDGTIEDFARAVTAAGGVAGAAKVMRAGTLTYLPVQLPAGADEVSAAALTVAAHPAVRTLQRAVRITFR